VGGQCCTQLLFTLPQAVNVGGTLRRLPTEHADLRGNDF
jgi:hypothetical protein